MTTKNTYFSLIEAILESEDLCLDYETQSDAGGRYGNMEYWHPHSRTVSASYTIEGEGTWVVPLSHPEGPWTGKDKTWDKDAKWRKVLFNLNKAIEQSGTKLVAHNIKYEGSWTHAMTGHKQEDQMWWDTCMSDYILDENEEHGLKKVAVRKLGVEAWDEVDLRDSEKVPWDDLALYNARDTDYCRRLVPIDREALLNEPRLARLFHFIGMPIIRTLTRIERRGMPIDSAVVLELKEQAEEIIEREQEFLLHHAVEDLGMDLDEYPTISFAGSTSKFFAAFMEKSELPIIKYTAKGNPSWDEDALKQLEANGYELASHVMAIRKNNNKLSKFFIPWTTKTAEDGRVHPSFNPMIVDDKWSDAKGTTTGRLSSSNFNAQQIAKDLKICFGGNPGWLQAELDYSQIELRIGIAWLAGDPEAMRAYMRGDDLHRLFAAALTGKKPEDIDDDERFHAKAGNFGFEYGMSAQGYVEYARKAFGIDVTLEEAKKVRKTFFRKYTRLEPWHERQRTLAFRNGFVRNPIGRKRRLPEIFSSNDYEVGRAERRAINAPVQSMASDLMCLALIEIEEQLDPDRFRLIGTVHDSLLAEVRADCWEDEVQRAASIMLDPGIKKKFGVEVKVPLEVEAKVGYHWNDPDSEVRVYRQ